jgi:hypothetical protein
LRGVPPLGLWTRNHDIALAALAAGNALLSTVPPWSTHSKIDFTSRSRVACFSEV